MRGVAGPRFSMSSYSTSLLWTVRWFMYSGGRDELWGEVLASFSLGPRAPPRPNWPLPTPTIPNPNSGWPWRAVVYSASALGPLTGPEAAVGAHQAHDDAAGQSPGERRHSGERPFHMQGHLPRPHRAPPLPTPQAARRFPCHGAACGGPL